MSKHRFFACFSIIFRLLFLAAVTDAAYILYYIASIAASPGAALARGMTLFLVPAMTEHVLMSVTLLLLCALAAEFVRRWKFTS